MPTYRHADSSHYTRVPQRRVGCARHQPVVHLVEVQPTGIRRVLAGKVKHGYTIHWGQVDGKVDGEIVGAPVKQKLAFVSMRTGSMQKCIRYPQNLLLDCRPRHLRREARRLSDGSPFFA